MFSNERSLGSTDTSCLLCHFCYRFLWTKCKHIGKYKEWLLAVWRSWELGWQTNEHYNFLSRRCCTWGNNGSGSMESMQNKLWRILPLHIEFLWGFDFIKHCNSKQLGNILTSLIFIEFFNINKISRKTELKRNFKSRFE